MSTQTLGWWLFGIQSVAYIALCYVLPFRYVLRSGRFWSGRQLFWYLLVGGVLVVAALRVVLAFIAQLGELLVERLDSGVLLAKDFLYQVVAVGFERLLLGEKF